MISGVESKVRIAFGMAMLAYCAYVIVFGDLSDLSTSSLTILLCVGILLTRMGVQSQ